MSGMTGERRMLYDLLHRPFSRIRVHAPGARGHVALALGAGPIGVFLMLRRMSLVGDAMAHAILPGAAIGFLLSGLSLLAMTAGGLIAGFVVALLTGLVARTTELKEDAALATFYLLSLALASPSSRSRAPISICCTCCSATCSRSTTRPCC